MSLKMRFRFSPTQDGLVKVLGPLETEIMELLWKENQGTVKQIHRSLQHRRDIAYTTVMTTMSRLAEKGILHRTRDGLAYVYSPELSQDEFVQMVVQQVLDGLLDDYPDMTLSYVVDYLARNDPSQLKQLSRDAQNRYARV
ncbi:BlaI/MecI/CopY family transcriptional regulator [Herpetosiphon giganteus]|uniref:BlaI/MecI/CopY family transcriptional regulator n=1 Tax=Herpetosiphon giganteus TaxID=2029754 RepID=UPI0019591593|nr:BlaI/MecI/CopY family transcriptional regulator [Herpetosiphon giganteus]MBM7846714.1 putative transcriptional regulator [Herpetosiphon giganteus]